jgi:hypothetical protein
MISTMTTTKVPVSPSKMRTQGRATQKKELARSQESRVKTRKQKKTTQTKRKTVTTSTRKSAAGKPGRAKAEQTSYAKN